MSLRRPSHWIMRGSRQLLRSTTQYPYSHVHKTLSRTRISSITNSVGYMVPWRRGRSGWWRDGCGTWNAITTITARTAFNYGPGLWITADTRCDSAMFWTGWTWFPPIKKRQRWIIVVIPLTTSGDVHYEIRTSRTTIGNSAKTVVVLDEKLDNKIIPEIHSRARTGLVPTSDKNGSRGTSAWRADITNGNGNRAGRVYDEGGSCCCPSRWTLGSRGGGREKAKQCQEAKGQRFHKSTQKMFKNVVRQKTSRRNNWSIKSGREE